MRSFSQFGNGADTSDAVLCPRCGYNCTHHGEVTVYDRSEDAEFTRVTRVGDVVSSAILPSNGCENPSNRRHGLAINFKCETCPARWQLTISQHKGETFIQWREMPARTAQTMRQLQSRWPDAFGRVRPLKIGIDRDIVSHAALAMEDVSVALDEYVTSQEYLERCCAGIPRVDLAGDPCGCVTDDQAARARELLRLSRSRG